MENPNESQEEQSVMELDEEKFIDVMSVPKTKKLKLEKKLINEHNKPLKDFIHPLTHSIDIKKHPDMVSIPVCYKYSRNLLKKLQKLTADK